MSDHDATPDPMDKAYAQAEAVLSDDDARAARRARVLTAIAREAATPPAKPLRAIRRPAWRRVRWLVAASIAGLSVFLATQVYLPALNPPQIAPMKPAIPTPATHEISASPTPAARGPSQTLEPAPRIVAATPAAATPLSDQRSTVAPSPPLQVAQGPEARPDAAPAPSSEVSEIVVVTGERRASSPALSSKIAPLAGPPTDQAAKLRDAAAAGRTAEVAALLAKGVPVDAPDEFGDTALMKSIHADHPAAAALLRRHGASLDLKNRAGDSARDMAVSIGDTELNQVLGIGR